MRIDGDEVGNVQLRISGRACFSAGVSERDWCDGRRENEGHVARGGSCNGR